MNMGLTGGIATGKSTVSAMLSARGAILIDADQIAREVMEPGHAVLNKVVETFGKVILQDNGHLDRKKLGEIVFGDDAAREQLNQITHPAIRSEMRLRQTNYQTQYPQKLIVSDVPLLYELGLEDLFDAVMVVYIPRELQLRRLMERDSLSQSQAIQRLNAQMDIEVKKERADILIDNSLELMQLESQIDRFWRDQDLL